MCWQKAIRYVSRRVIYEGIDNRPQKYPFPEPYRALIRNGLILEKWGKMGESVGNSGCLMEKWGILGLKRPKNMVLIGSKGMLGVQG